MKNKYALKNKPLSISLEATAGADMDVIMIAKFGTKLNTQP